MAAFTKVSIADEGTFAALATAGGRPDTSTLTFAQVEFESVDFTVVTVTTPRQPTSCSTAESPDAQGEQRNAAGEILVLRRGTLTLKHYVHQVGSSGLPVPDLTSFKLANTLRVDEGAPPNASDNISAGVSTTRITPTSAISWEHGLLASFLDATTEKPTSTRCTGTTGGNKILSPALLAQPANGATAHFYRQLYAKRTWSTVTKAVRLMKLEERAMIRRIREEAAASKAAIAAARAKADAVVEDDDADTKAKAEADAKAKAEAEAKAKADAEAGK